MISIYTMPNAVSSHYLKRYARFISSIRNPCDVVTESHHILPKSMGGSDDESNLIDLTPRQHYLAHWMLWKAYKSKEMTAAFFAMSHQNNPHQNRDFRLASRSYEQLRLNFSKTISESSKELWESNEYREKHRITNLSAKTKKIRSDKAKALWQDPNYRERAIQSRKKMWSEGRFIRDHSKCGTKGDKNPAKRPEVKAKNSGDNHYSNRVGYTKPTCPYCGISSTPTNINRWHGAKCKKLIPAGIVLSVSPSNTI